MPGLVAETIRDIKRLAFPSDGRYALPFRPGLPNERNYRDLVGDGSHNSIVAAAVNWVVRNGPSAPLVLVREEEEGVPIVIRRHPFLTTWRRPTWIPEERRSWYGGRELLMAILASFTIDGNAYVYKVRSQTGEVVQRWYIPQWLIEPRWPQERGNRVFISHYEYRPFGVPVELDPADVDHFRFGLDPQNTRKGLSPIASVFRELGIDEEASRFTASVLINFGMPGVLISPANLGDKTKTMDENARLALKEQFIQNFSGDRRGEPMVLSRPAQLEQFGFSPKDLELSALRDVPEERVSAVMGIPAAVLGLGTGLQGVKVGATMRVNWDMAWKGNLIPTQAMLAEQMWAQSLPEFIEDDNELDATMPFFDYTRAGVLHEERMANASYWATLARAGVARRREARAGVALTVSAEDDVYIPSPGVELVSPEAEPDDDEDGEDGDTGDEDDADE